MKKVLLLLLSAGFLGMAQASAADTAAAAEEGHYRVFQFPRTAIPRIDGDFSDWARVPESYAVTYLWDDSGKHDGPCPESISIKVKVGWVEGLNRLYFYYEAYDDYWEFSEYGLHNDTYELVVDGNLSGEANIARFRYRPDEVSEEESFYHFQNVHAQNYHIMTPPTEGKSWTMVWGPQQWLKYLPYANYAYNYDFVHGQSGVLKMEFYITPFDYAAPEGPETSVESRLYEGKKIGLCWAVIDYDGGRNNNGFWNLSPHHKMYGDAALETVFELCPLEPALRKPLEARWDYWTEPGSFTVHFVNRSYGDIVSYHWDFGDGTTSTDSSPVHVFAEASMTNTVTLTVRDAKGEEVHCCKVWEVLKNHPMPSER